MDKIKKYIGAVVLGTAILAIPGCSDTWDEHYGTDPETTSASKSLWDLISTNPKLTRFKEIAEKASYYRDEEHPQTDYTFKKMLDGSLLLTVWAPEDDAFTDAEFDNWMTLAETRGYTVQQQLLANSIALWRNVATGGGVDTLTMLNGKKVAFDKDKFTMSGIPMDQDNMNIAATNGTLHIMRGQALPFQYNLFEYLKDEVNAANMQISRFHDYVIERDTTYFSEASSVEGSPDINGNPTYVDSVYFTTNLLLHGNHRFPTNINTDQYLTYDESFGANIQAEDSSFIMLMPNDAAWQTAYQKLEGYYNYAKVYANKVKMEGGESKVIKLPLNEEINTDSLKEKSINMDIISPLCFNLNMQPNADGKKGRWKMEDFIASKGAEATYFLNTFGDTLRSDENWQKESLFNGQQIETSNGVAFIVNEWNFPKKLYKPDLIIEVGYQSLYNLEKAESDGQYTPYNFSNENAEEWVDTVGRVSNNNFWYFEPKSASGSPKFNFRLVGTDGENYESEVMSGKYDILAVMVPNFYRYSGATIEGDTLKCKIKGTISYIDGKKNDGKETTFDGELKVYDGLKVDTLMLFEDFEFPVSYKNLRQAFPTIQLSTKSSSTERNKEGYSNAFCIDRIILRSKD